MLVYSVRCTAVQYLAVNQGVFWDLHMNKTIQLKRHEMFNLCLSAVSKQNHNDVTFTCVLLLCSVRLFWGLLFLFFSSSFCLSLNGVLSYTFLKHPAKVHSFNG